MAFPGALGAGAGAGHNLLRQGAEVLKCKPLLLLLQLGAAGKLPGALQEPGRQVAGRGAPGLQAGQGGRVVV